MHVIVNHLHLTSSTWVWKRKCTYTFCELRRWWKWCPSTRAGQLSVRDKTGPRAGSDRTRPVLFGPIFGLCFWWFQSSVWSRVGLVDRWTGLTERSWEGMVMSCGTGRPCRSSAEANARATWSCSLARSDRAHILKGHKARSAFVCADDQEKAGPKSV